MVHLIYDVRDAMGANAVNTAVERLAPQLETISGGKAHLRILSNLADHRLARAECTIPLGELAFDAYTAEDVRDGIISAWAFAVADPYRAATHNKGIMNGIDPVVIATGNDWRAIEAGAHAYAARSGRYTSLSTWGQDAQGNLVGSLEMPMAVGIVGGATQVHPVARAILEANGSDHRRVNWQRSSSRWGWRKTWQPCVPWRLRVSSAVTWACMPVRWQLQLARKVR